TRTRAGPRTAGGAMTAPPVATAVVRIAAGCALLASWAFFYVLALSGLQEARSQQLLYGQLRERLSAATQPIGGAIEPGTPRAPIGAPRIGMRYAVGEGPTPGALRAAPGHRRDTPLPGQAGACVLYGRGVAFGGPFQHVTDLRPGDTVTVTTG